MDTLDTSDVEGVTDLHKFTIHSQICAQQSRDPSKVAVVDG